VEKFDGGRGRGGQNEVCGFGEKGIGGLNGVNGVVDQGRDGFSKVWDPGINPGSLAMPKSRVDEGNRWDSIIKPGSPFAKAE